MTSVLRSTFAVVQGLSCVIRLGVRGIFSTTSRPTPHFVALYGLNELVYTVTDELE